MDDEKIQRTLEFILENQAQFTVDVQKLGEANSVAEKRINTLERVALNLYNSVTELTKNVDELRQGQRETNKNVNELTKNINELRESQKETDDRLNVVILMIERYLSGENGKSK